MKTFAVLILLAVSQLPGSQMVETQKYRRAAVEVQAVQVTANWFDGDKTRHRNPLPGVSVDPLRREVFIQTRDAGTVHVPVGGWIIVDAGRLSTMHHAAFVSAHEKVAR